MQCSHCLGKFGGKGPFDLAEKAFVYLQRLLLECGTELSLPWAWAQALFDVPHVFLQPLPCAAPPPFPSSRSFYLYHSLSLSLPFISPLSLSVLFSLSLSLSLWLSLSLYLSICLSLAPPLAFSFCQRGNGSLASISRSVQNGLYEEFALVYEVISPSRPIGGDDRHPCPQHASEVQQCRRHNVQASCLSGFASSSYVVNL